MTRFMLNGEIIPKNFCLSKEKRIFRKVNVTKADARVSQNSFLCFLIQEKDIPILTQILLFSVKKYNTNVDHSRKMIKMRESKISMIF